MLKISRAYVGATEYSCTTLPATTPVKSLRYVVSTSHSEIGLPMKVISCRMKHSQTQPCWHRFATLSDPLAQGQAS